MSNETSLALYPWQQPEFGQGGNYTPSQSQNQFISQNGGYTGNTNTDNQYGSRGFQNLALGAQAASSLAGMVFGFQNNKQAKKQFGIENQYAETNLYNNAIAYNANEINKVENGLASRGIQRGSPEWNEAIARVKANAAQTSIKG